MTRVTGTHIGPGHPTYVVAEAGSNHNDSLDTAYRLIEAAANAGADACKFQFFRSDTLYPGQHTPHAIPDEWLPKLQKACSNAGIAFFCSVFDSETLQAYLEIDPPAIKIASPEATNHALLREAADSGLPLIVSTGAMGWDDLDDTVEALTGADVILLHCVAAYPAPFGELNLACIQSMRERYGLLVGFSDHSVIGTPAVYAVAAGACLIEKHLTLDRGQSGPDHPFAFEPKGFAQTVGEIRSAEWAMGDGVKRVTASEDAHDRRGVPA